MENIKTKRGSEERFTEGRTSLLVSGHQVLESQKLTDENRTRTGHVGSEASRGEARQTQKQRSQQQALRRVFRLQGGSQMLYTFLGIAWVSRSALQQDCSGCGEGGRWQGGTKAFLQPSFNALSLSQTLKITGHRPEYDRLQKVSLENFHFGTLQIQHHNIGYKRSLAITPLLILDLTKASDPLSLQWVRRE